MKNTGIIFWHRCLMIVVSIRLIVGQNVSYEKSLSSDLLDGYVMDVRPRPISPGETDVFFALGFVQILEVDERNEVLKSIVWFRLEWEDLRLSWDRNLYGMTMDINVPADSIWKPDLLLSNTYSIGDGFRFTDPPEEDDQTFYANVNYEGKVKLHFPAIVQSTCKMNIADYPFDSQVCTLEFVSWSLDAHAVSLVLLDGGRDKVTYVAHKSWTLNSDDITIKDSNMKCPFDSSRLCSTITYNIPIKRTSTFEVINYTLPAIIIAILSLLVFLVPPEVGKRMECGITLILCLAVYLGVVNKKMPSTSEAFPLITKFYACVIVEISVAMVLSCFCLHIYDPEGISLFEHSQMLRTLTFGFLARLIHHPYRKNPNKIGVMGEKSDDPDQEGETVFQRLLRQLPEIIQQPERNPATNTPRSLAVRAEKKKKKKKKDSSDPEHKKKKRAKHKRKKDDASTVESEGAPTNTESDPSTARSRSARSEPSSAGSASRHNDEPNDGRPDSGFAETEWNDEKGSLGSSTVGSEERTNASRDNGSKNSGLDLNFVLTLPDTDIETNNEEKRPLKLPTKPQKSADLTYRVKKRPQARKPLNNAPYSQHSPVRERRLRRQTSKSDSLKSPAQLTYTSRAASTTSTEPGSATLSVPVPPSVERRSSTAKGLFKSIVLRHMAPGPSVALANMIERENKKLRFEMDWMMQAMILNRFFLIGLAVAVVLSLLAVFLQSPRLRFAD